MCLTCLIAPYFFIRLLKEGTVLILMTVTSSGIFDPRVTFLGLFRDILFLALGLALK